MKFEDILYTAQGGVATLTINRAEVRNAVRPRTYEELTAAMHMAADDPTVGVVVLTGAGDKAFCSGGDIRDQQARVPEVGRKHMRRLFALSSVMRMMDKPIIAKVRGFCVGSGNEINLFCDMTIASEDAKFGQTGPRVGSVPIWGACQLLARYVGERKAREMLYTCRQYTAQQALEMGLINEVVKAEDLDATVDALCQDILDKSPQSIRIAKLALNAGSDQEFYGSYFPNAELLASIYGNEENSEGITAFLQKRKPDYRKYRVSRA
ncbi:enoyl-CoA hydratase-related protein [Hydrogenophaga crocea]|jgi:dihydroxynaphthoic acid synthetase|uniref:1,4-dihydroxy-6-naphthoate synthase n=1 Tax=Hydrogenophaga crocea TaxID=2716225 RepID=A0A6G8IJ07_9BURK|nr:enoyl-CoA hydratase-related protein [Hydrogenophaga crocea]QIM53197.1 1,4-dihydroxy-6-naphthoate synthase [Hydrogenophaga crocea]